MEETLLNISGIDSTCENGYRLTGPAWWLSWGDAAYLGSCYCIFHFGHLSCRPGTYQTSPTLKSAWRLCSSWHTHKDTTWVYMRVCMSGSLTFSSRLWHSLDLTDDLSCSSLQKSLDAPDQVHFLQNTQSRFMWVCVTLSPLLVLFHCYTEVTIRHVILRLLL